MNFLSQKETIQKELSILQQKAANRIDFYEEDILVTHWNLRDAVKNPRSEDELNVLYGNFIDSIEVKQSYVTIALNILTILGYRRNIYFIARKNTSTGEAGGCQLTGEALCSSRDASNA